jgi:hypothetical protein
MQDSAEEFCFFLKFAYFSYIKSGYVSFTLTDVLKTGGVS